MDENLKFFIRILEEEDELNNENLYQFMLASQFKNKELLNEDGDLFLTVDSLITVNNYQVQTIYNSNKSM